MSRPDGGLRSGRPPGWSLADSPQLEGMHKSPLRSRAESCGDDLRFILYGCGMTMKQVPSVLPAGTADDETLAALRGRVRALTDAFPLYPGLAQ